MTNPCCSWAGLSNQRSDGAAKFLCDHLPQETGTFAAFSWGRWSHRLASKSPAPHHMGLLLLQCSDSDDLAIL